MKNKRQPWEWIVAILSAVIFLMMASGCTKSYGQSKCDRDKIFVADFSIESKFANIGAPAMSVNMGLSGVYGKGTYIDNFMATVGAKVQKGTLPNKANPGSDYLLVIPTATAMYKLRFNGYDSKLVHALSGTYGLTDIIGEGRYFSIDYRCYLAPTVKSFATVGAILGWNNYEGFHFGFTTVGIF